MKYEICYFLLLHYFYFLKKKVCFILDVSNKIGGGQMPVQRLTHTATLDRDKGGGYLQNNTVISDIHLQTGHPWSDQHHLDYFKYS